MSHKVFAETIANKFREMRSVRDEDGSLAAGGPTLSTTLKSLAIPLGAEWVSLTPRNFAGAGTMRFALAPRLTIIVTTDLLATGGIPRNADPTALSTFPTQDISDEMQDGDQADFALDSFDTLANLDAIFIGSPLPFRGCTVDIGTSPQSTSNTLTVSYWAGGSDWTAVSGFTDNTDTGASFAQDGTVIWTVPDAWVRATLFGTADGIANSINETSIQETWSKNKLYWTRRVWDNAFNNNVDVRQIKALARNTDYSELTECQALEFAIDPLDVATLEVLTDAGNGNVIANAAVLGTYNAGKLPKSFKEA